MRRWQVWASCIYIGWVAAAWLASLVLSAILIHASTAALPDAGEICPVLVVGLWKFHIDFNVFYLRPLPCLSIWAFNWPWLFGGPFSLFILLPYVFIRLNAGARRSGSAADPLPLSNNADFVRPLATVAIGWVVVLLIVIVLMPILYRHGFFSM